jgi:hypothetical protein
VGLHFAPQGAEPAVLIGDESCLCELRSFDNEEIVCIPCPGECRYFVRAKSWTSFVFTSTWWIEHHSVLCVAGICNSGPFFCFVSVSCYTHTHTHHTHTHTQLCVLFFRGLKFQNVSKKDSEKFQVSQPEHLQSPNDLTLQEKFQFYFRCRIGPKWARSELYP